jgi:hypothetical protein
MLLSVTARGQSGPRAVAGLTRRKNTSRVRMPNSAASGADFIAATAGNEAALASCERELAELEREHGKRGKRLGGRRLLRCQRCAQLACLQALRL